MPIAQFIQGVMSSMKAYIIAAEGEAKKQAVTIQNPYRFSLAENELLTPGAALTETDRKKLVNAINSGILKHGYVTNYAGTREKLFRIEIAPAHSNAQSHEYRITCTDLKEVTAHWDSITNYAAAAAKFLDER